MNIYYVVYRKDDGTIMQSGICQTTVVDLLAKPGEAVLTFDQAPVVAGMKVLHEKIVQADAPVEVKHWSLLRRHAYPGPEVLADAMYWQAKGDDSKMTAYLAAVEAVKLQFPKAE